MLPQRMIYGTLSVDPQVFGFQRMSSSPNTIRAVLQFLPMQVGCVPLHVPSAWQVLLEDPTSMKGDLHWKKTSDL